MDTNETRSREGMHAARVRVPDHVVLRSFETETVVLNLDTGVYHAVNPTGGRFLDLLGEEGAFARVLARLQAEFADQSPASLERDLLRFCLDLETRGLLEVVEA